MQDEYAVLETQEEMFRTVCIRTLLQMRKSWDVLGKGKILYMLFFPLFFVYCHVYSEVSKTNISNFFGLSYGNEDLLG